MINTGVVLSGCGMYDGSEVHEATLTLFFLDRAGCAITCMAPNIDQMEVVDHSAGNATPEKRNVLVESTRISRGNIKDIRDLKAADLDALIFPGGLGTAKNLCNFAVKGPDCTVNSDVERLINEMHAAKKPMAFICIAPVVAAKTLGTFRPSLTIGNDPGTAGAIEKMGGRHVACTVDNIVVDATNRIVTTPAYMLGPTIAKVALGIEKLVQEVLKMTGTSR